MTSPKNLKIERNPRDHERIFLEQYDWLMERARHLTSGTPEDPQDLVQELYISFVLLKASPEFNDVAHVQAYLRKALKNLFTSRRMGYGRDITTRMSLVEFDSLEFALTAVDRSQLLYIRSDLARICEYALSRRNSNKGATAFIMRFFFGYLPSEITALLKLDRKSFEKMVQTARLEAKAYVQRPHVLRILHRQEKRIPEFPKALPEESDALFAELQRRMFFLPVGDHLSFELVDELYASSDVPLSVEQTAHLGSCRACLQRAGDVLNIPDILLQLFSEPNEPGDPNSTPQGSEHDELKKLRRKGREIFEHRPKELRLIIDGLLRGTQTVTAAKSRFQLNLNPLQRTEFVEIRSEQGVSMLYFDLEEGGELLEEREIQVSFSEGRTLTASFRFAEGAPMLEVFYYDPLLEASDNADSLNEYSSGLESRSPQDAITIDHQDRGRLWTRLLESCNLSRCKWWTLLVLSALLIGSYFLANKKRVVESPPMMLASAQDLLRISERNTRTEIPLGGGSQAVYRLQIVRAHHAPVSGQIKAVRSELTPRAALRYVTPSGKLVAGRWTDALGHAKNYVRGKSSSSGSTDAPVSQIWQFVPDVGDFSTLAGTSRLDVARTPNGYDLGFKRSRSTVPNQVVEVHLELSGPNLHATQERVEVQSNNETISYRLAEVSYQVLSPQQFAEEDLAPPSQGVSDLVRPAAVDDTPGLILRVLEVLQSDPEAETAIDLDRTAGGGLRLSGVLSSSAKTASLVRELRAVSGSQSLHLDLHSLGENAVSTGAAEPTHVVVSSVTAAQSEIPLEGMLQGFDAADDATGTEKEHFTEAANQLVAAGATLHREAWWTAGIASQWFTPSELRSLSPQEQRYWVALIEVHLRASEAALSQIRQELWEALPGASDGMSSAIPDVTNFAKTSDDLLRNAKTLDQLLAAGFALNPDSRPDVAAGSEIPPLIAAIQQQESSLIRTVESLQQRRH